MSVPLSFYLKKLLGAILMPLPLLLGLTVVGLMLIWRGRYASGRSSKFGWMLTTGGIACVYVLSLPFIPAAIHRALVPEQPVTLPDSVSYIVVLSGGVRADSNLSASNQLNESTRARLMEGLRLLRAHPEARLITTGGNAPGRPSSASVMKAAAIELGYDGDRMLVEDSSRDTGDEADFIAPMVGGEPFAVVSSARHIPRVLLLFRQRGLDPIPVYADYAYAGPLDVDLDSFLPSPHDLQQSTNLWHEALGFVWASLTSD